MLKSAFQLATWPAVISLFVTLVRLFGELAGIPSPITFLIGIIWLTLIVAVFWGLQLGTEKHPYRLLFLSLLVFALLSRIPVTALWWVTKTYQLGTHYDVFNSWGEALVNQFLFGTLLQIVPGGILGLSLLAIKRRHVEAATD